MTLDSSFAQSFPTYLRETTHVSGMLQPHWHGTMIAIERIEKGGFMRSDKRYTNQTFTKRVDHEAGQHHTPSALKEPAVCANCGNVYADRRWSKPDPARDSAKHSHVRPAQTTICPACKAIQAEIPSGYVHLAGQFLNVHREELEVLLTREAERAAEDNPLARIMGWDESEEGKLTVTTTTEHLAQRLGHALEKAYDGTVRYDFSHENKLAHVWWQRD